MLRLFIPPIQVRSLSLLFIALLFTMGEAYAQQQDEEEEGGGTVPPGVGFIVDSVDVTVADVFDGWTEYLWIPAIASPFHTETHKRTIYDEVFLHEGDTGRRNDLDEIERNLRGLGIFGSVAVELLPSPWEYPDEPDSALPHVVLQVRTRDTWSLRAYGNYQQNEDGIAYSGTLSEGNLLGRANVVGVGADYSSVNNRGWILGGFYLNPNIFSTHLRLFGSGFFGKNFESESFTLDLPFYTDHLRNGFATSFINVDGDELSYLGRRQRLSTRVRSFATGGWYARSSGGVGDVFRASVALDYNRTRRDTLGFLARAFENSASFFVGLGSIRRKFIRLADADFSGIRQVPIGGSGSVSIGKIAPHHGGNDNVVYVGGDVARALVIGNLYAWGRVGGGTGLSGKESRFTTLRLSGSATYLTHPGAISVYLKESTVWNWDHYVNAGASEGTFLRGYSSDDLVGNNRFQCNLEYRLNPIVTILIFDIGATLFADIGTVWNQGDIFSRSQFHSSIGAGLRISAAESKIQKGILRLDLARTLDRPGQFRLIIGTTESFDFSGTLDYRPPGPYTY